MSRVAMYTLTLGLSWLIVGCAQLPDWENKASLAESAPLEFSASSAVEPMDWPQDQWWQRYGSEQLNGLVSEALLGAPDMAAAAARLRQAQALLEATASARRPQLSAHARIVGNQLSDDFWLPNLLPMRGVDKFGSVTLDASWSLDLWGKHRAAIAAAAGELQAHEADAAQARLVLVSGVAAGYAALVRLSAMENTLAQSLALREATVRLFAERFDNGLENQGSVHSAKARMAAARMELAQAQEQMALQRHALAALIGARPDRGEAIVVAHADLNQPWRQQWGWPESLSLNLLGRRPDVVAARLQAQALESRVAVKQAQFYPDVNLAAVVGVQSVDLDMLLQRSLDISRVGAAISLPIFSGGRLRAELGAARARYDEAVALYRKTLNHALREVADNAVSQRALQQQLAAMQQAVDSAAQAQRVARARYAGGVASNLEVLAADDQWLVNMRQMVQVQARALSLDIDLHRVLGGGWQESPAQASSEGVLARWLNPEFPNGATHE
ncbi:MAG: efflux transporter outer membrane subunit [Comamonas sp.]